jgi:ribose transport system substrate-binding protein
VEIELMIRTRPSWSALAIGNALLAVTVIACGGTLDPPIPSTGSPGSVTASPGANPSIQPSPSAMTHRIGVSNTVDDGWRVQMMCSIKAEARASGRVDRLILANRETNAEGQAADVRNLVATGVDVIVLHPADTDAITDALSETIEAGVVVVSVGRPIDLEGVYTVMTDQEAYGYLGAKWLFEVLEGKGKVVVMRGQAHDPIDTERSAGFKRALAEFPGVEVVFEAQTDSDPTSAVVQINTFLATGKAFDGIWTSGTDSVVVDALKTAEADLVPIVGTDRGSFVSMLLDEEDLIGAAVTDTGAVGGAAVALALEILDGQPPDPASTLVTPQVWGNDTDEGRALLIEANDPSIDLEWPLSIMIPGRTSYSKDELLACVGPDQ